MIHVVWYLLKLHTTLSCYGTYMYPQDNKNKHERIKNQIKISMAFRKGRMEWEKGQIYRGYQLYLKGLFI